uniref:HTH cro/C1-type domain-containing protein n=1 Tax=uncultured Bacillota bacterium TaxID=344338 RepID=A0A650EP26_9FIRM|nr:hypothetical protein Firmicute1046_1570 [uncultured Firmicutes bacterium]
MYDTKELSKIAQRIRKLRKDRYSKYQKQETEKDKKYACCKSQETLAEALNVERRTIMSWETGKSQPSLDYLIALCNLLDCNIMYFLGGYDDTVLDTVAAAAHFSGISSKIICYGLEHRDFLDCLNYFMDPENCSSLFNNVTLSYWKAFMISQELSEIEKPFKDKVFNIFSEFCAVMPYDKIEIEEYTEFLMEKLPENSFSVSAKCSDNKIGLKDSLSFIKYREYVPNSRFKYREFINYLANYTFKPFFDIAKLELQKDKLAKGFIALFEQYLSDIE